MLRFSTATILSQSSMSSPMTMDIGCEPTTVCWLPNAACSSYFTEGGKACNGLAWSWIDPEVADPSACGIFDGIVLPYDRSFCAATFEVPVAPAMTAARAAFMAASMP